MPKRHLHKITWAMALATTLPLAFAQTAAPWPIKPIKLIVPDAAGGPAVVVARELALVLSADLKQPVTVENQGGADLGMEMFSSPPSLQVLADKGLLKVLAATAPSKSKVTKSLPLIGTALPGFDNSTW